jgi:arginine:agmatine antiporter
MTDQTLSPLRLGLLGAIMVTGSNMIGSGIYMLPATLGAIGSVSLVSWLIAGAGAIILALVFGLLGVLRPDANGVVTYAGEALHPALGYVSWFVYWLGCWISNSAVTVGLVGYLGYFIPALKDPTTSLVGCLIATWSLSIANMIGPKLVARIGGVTLIIGLVPVLMATGVGLAAFSPEIFHASWNVSGKPEALALSGAVTPIFFAFLGLEGANIAARVINNPQRNVPIAAIGGVLVAGTIYIAASAAIMGLLPAQKLATSTAPFADAIVPVVGAVAAGLVALCAFAKTTGTLGAGILFAAESQRSGVTAGFMPRMLSDPKRLNPIREIVLTSLLSSAAILATASPTLGGQFLILINVTVILSMIFYLLCALSLFRLSGEVAKPVQRLAARGIALAGAGFCIWVLATADAGLRMPAAIVVAVSLALWAAGVLVARLKPPTLPSTPQA